MQKHDHAMRAGQRAQKHAGTNSVASEASSSEVDQTSDEHRVSSQIPSRAGATASYVEDGIALPTAQT